MQSLPLRQVHLDFHTAPQIPGIGDDFDPQEFTQILCSAHVNSVTVFAKCHHGYSYYPTQVGTPHPHLRRDLLGEMVAACREAGIRVQAYTTVVWDELAWAEHPEWRQIFVDGHVGRPGGLLQPGWKNLCLNTSYGDYVIAQIEEVLERYPVDGVFVDIVRYLGGPCVCSTCLGQMREQGVDPLSPDNLYQFALDAERRFIRRCTAAIRARNPNAASFYNSRLRIEADAALGSQPEMDDFSHIEIESLPGGFWGYSHFPLYARFFQRFPKPLIGMTGRFHTTWGDFGGLRNRAALAFECFQSLAHGAGCSIGDQLHPRGRLEPAVYARIGEVYAEVERREPWVQNTAALAEVGVFSVHGAPGISGEALFRADGGMPLSDLGALHALEEEKVQFHVLDSTSNVAPYKVLILPDSNRLDAATVETLRRFVKAGGSLLVTDRAGLDGDNFALSAEMGLDFAGPAEFAPDYLLPGPEIAGGIEPMPHVLEQPGTKIHAHPTARVLAYSGRPYFNRTWEHFCSHQYTPLEGDSGEPVIVQSGRVIYIARPLFRDYALSGRRVYRQVIANCLSLLLPRPLVGRHNLPSTAIVTVRQRGQDRIVHLLHYVHQRRGLGLDVIEDVLPLVDVELSIRAVQKPRAVTLVPEMQPVEWQWDDGYVRMRLPRVNGYQIVLLEGAED